MERYSWLHAIVLLILSKFSKPGQTTLIHDDEDIIIYLRRETQFFVCALYQLCSGALAN